MVGGAGEGRATRCRRGSRGGTEVSGARGGVGVGRARLAGTGGGETSSPQGPPLGGRGGSWSAARGGQEPSEVRAGRGVHGRVGGSGGGAGLISVVPHVRRPLVAHAAE